MPVILSGGVVTSGGATPTFIQSTATPSDTQTQSPFSTGTGSITTCFPNSTQSGNTIIVRLTSSSTLANISSVTDDGSSSNTYTQQKTEVVSSRTLAIYTAPVTNVSRCTTVLYTSGPVATDNEVKIYEFSNIATSSPLDVSCNGSVTSGTAPACSSSMTPTVAGDLILTFVDIKTFTSTPTGAMTFTAQTGTTPTYQLLPGDADGTSWSAGDYAIDSATSAITPSITISQSTTQAQVVAIALKAASSGSGFSGIHVNNVAKFAPQFAYSTAITGTAQVIQFPCVGNDLWVIVGIGDNTTVSSINTDSNSNTWTGLTRVDSTGDGFSIQWYHSDSATCSGTEKFTINFAAAPSFMTVVAVDISNATGYDSSATCAAGSTPCPINVSSGGDANSTTTISGAKITPSTAAGVVLSYQNQDFDSMCAVSPGNFVADLEGGPSGGACASGSASIYNYEGSGFEQDMGLLVKYYSSTAQISITWSIANTQSRAIGPEFSSTVAVKQ